jgi:hypothetical protein
MDKDPVRAREPAWKIPGDAASLYFIVSELQYQQTDVARPLEPDIFHPHLELSDDLNLLRYLFLL